MRRLSLIVAAFAFLLGACERHSWEDADKNGDGVIDQNEKGTSRLFKEHGKEHGGKEAGHPESGEKEPAGTGAGEEKHP